MVAAEWRIACVPACSIPGLGEDVGPFLPVGARVGPPFSWHDDTAAHACLDTGTPAQALTRSASSKI